MQALNPAPATPPPTSTHPPPCHSPSTEGKSRKPVTPFTSLSGLLSWRTKTWRHKPRTGRTLFSISARFRTPTWRSSYFAFPLVLLRLLFLCWFIYFAFALSLPFIFSNTSELCSFDFRSSVRYHFELLNLLSVLYPVFTFVFVLSTVSAVPNKLLSSNVFVLPEVRDAQTKALHLRYVLNMMWKSAV